jgi:hypothetical protein
MTCVALAQYFLYPTEAFEFFNAAFRAHSAQSVRLYPRETLPVGVLGAIGFGTVYHIWLMIPCFSAPVRVT